MCGQGRSVVSLSFPMLHLDGEVYCQYDVDCCNDSRPNCPHQQSAAGVGLEPRSSPATSVIPRRTCVDHVDSSGRAPSAKRRILHCGKLLLWERCVKLRPASGSRPTSHRRMKHMGTAKRVPASGLCMGSIMIPLRPCSHPRCYFPSTSLSIMR